MGGSLGVGEACLGVSRVMVLCGGGERSEESSKQQTMHHNRKINKANNANWLEEKEEKIKKLRRKHNDIFAPTVSEGDIKSLSEEEVNSIIRLKKQKKGE